MTQKKTPQVLYSKAGHWNSRLLHLLTKVALQGSVCCICIISGVLALFVENKFSCAEGLRKIIKKASVVGRDISVLDSGLEQDLLHFAHNSAVFIKLYMVFPE